MTIDIRHFSTETYNGWANYQTWNVALWIGNDESIYRQVIGLLNNKVTEYSAIAKCLSVMFGEETPDGTLWQDENLNHAELNEMLLELID